MPADCDTSIAARLLLSKKRVGTEPPPSVVRPLGMPSIEKPMLSLPKPRMLIVLSKPSPPKALDEPTWMPDTRSSSLSAETPVG